MRFAIVSVALLVVFPAHANANPYAAKAATFIGEYFLGKALDAAWDSSSGKPDVDELDSRLSMLERSVRRVDRDLSRRVSEFRNELDTKVSRSEVRALVRGILTDLEERIAGLEQRANTIDERVKQLEEVFGFIPTVPPAPLIRSSVVEGRPRAHPLVVRWAKLLTESEVNRRKIAKLLQVYQEDAPVVAEAKERRAELTQQIRDLHREVKLEVLKRLDERQKLLEEEKLKPAHPKVRQLDDNLASVLWLQGVTKPIQSGEQKGRLAVPKELVGPACSDILIAFKEAGVDTAELVPLFRQLLNVELNFEEATGFSAGSLEFAQDIQTRLNEASSLTEQAQTLRTHAARIEQKLQEKLKVFTASNPKVKTLLQAKRETLSQIQSLHEDSEQALEQSLAVYLKQLQLERPTGSRMVAFRRHCLKPLLRIARVTRSRNWKNSVARRDTWKRFLADDSLSPNLLHVPFDEQSAADAQQKWASMLSRQVIETNSLDMPLVLIPPGKFRMGTSRTELSRITDHFSKDATDNKKPTLREVLDNERAVQVTLTKPYYVSKTEVTQGQWASLMETAPWEGEKKVRDAPDYPATYISWKDAMEFCREFTSQVQRSRPG